MTLFDLEYTVVCKMHCPDAIFWKCVADAGWTRPRVLSAVRRCRTAKALRKFISKFI